MQHLWQEGLEWDQELPPTAREEWVCISFLQPIHIHTRSLQSEFRPASSPSSILLSALEIAIFFSFLFIFFSYSTIVSTSILFFFCLTTSLYFWYTSFSCSSPLLLMFSPRLQSKPSMARTDIVVLS